MKIANIATCSLALAIFAYDRMVRSYCYFPMIIPLIVFPPALG